MIEKLVNALFGCRHSVGCSSCQYNSRLVPHPQHGIKVDLHLKRLWSRNISITTRLVDTVTVPMLLKTVQSRKISPTLLITHRFKLERILDAYDTFERAASTQALKVIIDGYSANRNGQRIVNR